MKYLSFYSLLIFAFLMYGCKGPEEKVIGVWEYDSYEVDESGIGIIAGFIPGDWKESVDEFIEESKGLTNSILVFKADGTYEESFSGAAKQFTAVKGHYSVTPDFSEIRLKYNGQEQVMKLLELEENYFIYQKEFTKYKVPLTLNISYKRSELSK